MKRHTALLVPCRRVSRVRRWPAGGATAAIIDGGARARRRGRPLDRHRGLRRAGACSAPIRRTSRSTCIAPPAGGRSDPPQRRAHHRRDAVRGRRRRPHAGQRLLRAADPVRPRAAAERRLHRCRPARPCSRTCACPCRFHPAARRRRGRRTPTARTTRAPAISTATANTSWSSSGSRPTRRTTRRAATPGNVYIDAYTLTGTRLWRIDLGRNIRAGAHYTQFMVYDLDGDGKAEVACKTADGTVDGAGNVIGDPRRRLAQHRRLHPRGPGVPDRLRRPDRRRPRHHALRRPARNGRRLGRHVRQPRGPLPGHDRLSRRAAAQPGDGARLLHARGAGGLELARRRADHVWTFDTGHTGTPNPYAGWRGRAITTSASATWTATAATRSCTAPPRSTTTAPGSVHDGPGPRRRDPHVRHGSRSARPGGVPAAREPRRSTARTRSSCAMRARARWSSASRARATSAAASRWTSIPATAATRCGARVRPAACTRRSSRRRMRSSVRAASQISAAKPSINFGVWWDGDLLRELLDGTTISKWNWLAGNTSALLAPAGVSSNNGTKATPALSADILGDWREEVVWRESTNDALRALHDDDSDDASVLHADARSAVPCRRSPGSRRGYNQPPHPGFFLGDGMAPPPGAEHRDVAAHAARARRPGVHRRLGGHRRLGRRLRHRATRRWR